MRITRHLVMAAVVAAALVGGGSRLAADRRHGDTGDVKRALDALLADTVDATGVPGLAIRLVTHEGAVASAAGVRQAGLPVPFLAGDPVHIGSCLKAMTATVVARLVERRVMRWETTIEDALPDLAGTMDPELRGVTVEELLAHRSGLTDEVPPALFSEALTFQGSGREARAYFVTQYLALPPGGRRGSFSYSNFGYAVVGAMMEQITGESYDALLLREVLEPLRMTSAQFGAPGSNDPTNIDAPRGHGPDGTPLPANEQDDPAILAPAGTFSMTLRDWARFALAQVGVSHHGPRLVSPTSLTRMQRGFGGELPSEYGGGRYGLGWYLLEVDGVRLLTHDGSNGAWYSRIVINPRTRRIMLLSANEASLRAATALERISLDARVRRFLGDRDWSASGVARD